jgi:uncharacterized metal-binding protein YceD (DUF177 family)
MDKIFIKDVPFFCQSNLKISGKTRFKTSEYLDPSLVNTMIIPQEIFLEYFFEGVALSENHFCRQGAWNADIQLICTYCSEPLIESLEVKYESLRLVDEKENSFDYLEDCQECRLDYFDLRPWLFSEIMMMVPISPKHATCALPFE